MLDIIKKVFLFYFFITVILTLQICLKPQYSFAQISSIQTMIEEVEQYKNQISVLQDSIKQMTNILLKKSEKIEKIKVKESANILNSRKLHDLLAQSKLISNNLDSLQERLTDLNHIFKIKTQNLLIKIDDEMLFTFRKYPGITKNSKEYSMIIKRLDDLYQMRRLYESFISEPILFSIQFKNVEITADEQVGTKREKIDLLKDQEDFLRSITLIIDNNIIKTKDWLRLTRQANDLLEDLRFQQTNDENIYRSSVQNSKNVFEANVDLNNNKGTEGSRIEKTTSIATTVYPIDFDILFLSSPDKLNDQIKKLVIFKNQLTFKADSIANKIIEYQR